MLLDAVVKTYGLLLFGVIFDILSREVVRFLPVLNLILLVLDLQRYEVVMEFGVRVGEAVSIVSLSDG